MRRRSSCWIVGVSIGLFPASMIAACGSRTDLDQVSLEESVDAHTPTDVSLDVTRDGSQERDTSIFDVAPPPDDAPIVIFDAEIPDDFVPPIPGIDASIDPDAGTTCADGGESTAYLVAENDAFYSFDPSTLTTHLLGNISCPDTSTPFTMTVSQAAAWVMYQDGFIFRVDLQTLACTSTSFVPGSLGFPGDVGIATSRATDTQAEGLLVYGATSDGTTSVPTLAASDLSSFVLTEIGPIVPTPHAGYPVDIKTDAFGRLFALDASGTLLQVDSTTGALLAEDATGLEAGAGWALLTWHDQLYVFTQATGVISRWDLDAKQAITVGAVGDTIVGASAAPCIP